MQEVLDPGEVGVASRRVAVAPALVALQSLAAPVGDVEGRIGEDVVGAQVGVAVVVEYVAVSDLAFDAADGEFHRGPCARWCSWTPGRRWRQRLLSWAPEDRGPGRALPLPVAWAWMNRMDWTNMPEEPQQGS